MTVRITKPKINVREALDNNQVDSDDVLRVLYDAPDSVVIGNNRWNNATNVAKLSINDSISHVYNDGNVNVNNCVLGLGNFPESEQDNQHTTLQFNLNAGTYNRVGGISFVAKSENNQLTDLAFWTDGGGSLSRTEKMRIDGYGRVGIGTKSPDATLDVQTLHSVSNRFYTSNDSFAAHPHNGTLLMAFRIPNTSDWTEMNRPMHASCDITLRVMTAQSANHTSTGVKSYHLMFMRPHNNSGTAATATVVDLRAKEGSGGANGLYQEVGSAATCNSFDLVVDTSGATNETQYVRLRLNSTGDTGTAVYVQMSVNYSGSSEIERSS